VGISLSFSFTAVISDNGRLQTPPSKVPAKRFVPDTARALIAVFVKPNFTAIQLEPLWLERKTPFNVPAKRFVPETAML
jgi:hypothetical protein